MAVSMKDLGIDSLSSQDRLTLMQEIWDSLAAEIKQAPLTPAQQREVDRRWTAHRANPDAAIPWEKVEAEALARLEQ